MYHIEELYNLYKKDVFIYLYSMTRNKEVAEDLLQDTFINVIKGLSGFKGNASVKTWIMVIAKNAFYRYYKNNNKYQIVELHETIEDIVSLDNEENLIIKSDINELMQYLDKIDKMKKEIIIYRDFNKLNYYQISNIYGKTESWARVTYYRAKQELLKFYEKGV